MALVTDFIPLQLDQLRREAAVRKVEGWRFIQTLAVNTDDGIDLYYSFMKDGRIENLRIQGVQKDQPVPSITDLFFAAFVFENEARELFGVDMRDIAIDFAGAMYAPAVQEPMTIITPEQKAAREKARKAASAKAAKEAAPADAEASAAPAKRGFVMTPERQARLDAKLANMSPEKVAKVEAALKARAAEAEAAPAAAVAKDAAPAAKEEGKAAAAPAAPSEEKPAEKADAVLEAKLAGMDPAKAAKVRAVLQGGQPASGNAVEAGGATGEDAVLASKLASMDPEKAAKVRAALAAQADTKKGGE